MLPSPPNPGTHIPGYGYDKSKKSSTIGIGIRVYILFFFFVILDTLFCELFIVKIN